ncbi:MAG: hypothetical protein OXI97_01125, partial [Acidimicrobiaceae bacterium]|nr:hypothetical protein [Acidimicrobiaceae bacterium]
MSRLTTSAATRSAAASDQRPTGLMLGRYRPTGLMLGRYRPTKLPGRRSLTAFMPSRASSVPDR